MDVLCYYKNQRRVAVFELQKDFRVRTVGSYQSNDYVVPDEAVAAIHLKVKFQNGIYKVMAMEHVEIEGYAPLPLNCWLNLPPQKKLQMVSHQKEDYLIFLQNVEIKKAAEAKIIQKTAQMKSPEVEMADQIPEAPQKTGRPMPAYDDRLRATVHKQRKDISKETGTHTLGRAKRESAVDHPEPKGAADKETLVNNAEPPLKPKLTPDPALEGTVEDGMKVANMESADRLSQETCLEGRYRILSVLGKGGMGVVYKVLDEKINRVVALKLLLARGKASIEAQERFVAEARAMAKLRHKNIVRVYDNGIHEGLPYFTMDFVEGKELPKCIKNLKPRQAMSWMVAICDAVHYFHQSGVIHRDLKPSNIMIAESGEPILMDFGIARDEASRSSLTAAGQSIGTPAYMPPEQAKGLLDQIDERTDIYGLGTILYEMMTQQPPFSGPPIQVLYKVCNEEPTSVQTLNPLCPMDIVTIITKAMSKDRAFRYASAQEMATDIDRFLDGLRIHAQPPSLALRIVRKFKQNRAYSYGLVGAAVVVLVLTAISLYLAYKTAEARERKIREVLAQSHDFLKKAQADSSNAIPHYIHASEGYTQVLGLDSENAEGREGRYKCLCQMAEYAMNNLHDYDFAQTMYKNALEMEIHNSEVEKRLKDLGYRKSQEKQEIRERVNEIFVYLGK